MSFLNQLTTGLLGYSLKKDFLGEGFFYRETETFDYTVYVKPEDLVTPPFKSIQSKIQSEFATKYSGDINVRVFDVPANYTFPNDSIRLGQFNVQVEIRKPVLSLASYMTEIQGNYYKGFDGPFIINNCNAFNDIKEDRTLEQNENGNSVYSHNISFSLKTGGKTLAVSLASGIFANEKDTTFGIYVLAGGIGAAITDTSNYQNYYIETYDLIRNTFSFSKKREILPTTITSYTYNLEHSVNFKEEGIIDVNEKGTIQGKINFSQASQGMTELISNSYGRCNNIYNKFKNFSANASVDDPLINLSLSTNKTLNKPSISAEYEVTYTNNINYTTGASIEKIINVENDGKYIGIDHTYNFTRFISPISPNLDVDYINFVNSASSESLIEMPIFYTSSPFYNSSMPTINRIKMSATVPNRRKTFNTSFSYTNKPTYFITLDGVIYSFFESTFSETKPVDIVTEYKIINRPSKTSIINYAYQTEKGTKNLQINAQLSRVADIFNSPLNNIGTKISSLYRYGIEKALSTFFGLNVFALSYHLVDVKYTLDSNNEIKLDITIDYTIKKYVA